MQDTGACADCHLPFAVAPSRLAHLTARITAGRRIRGVPWLTLDRLAKWLNGAYAVLSPFSLSPGEPRLDGAKRMTIDIAPGASFRLQHDL